jgi:hypothetical protein
MAKKKTTKRPIIRRTAHSRDLVDDLDQADALIRRGNLPQARELLAEDPIQPISADQRAAAANAAGSRA